MLTGAPFSTSQDSAVRVGGVAAALTQVDRGSCEVCDTCAAENGCNCGVCDACATACADCVQTVGFLVPDVAAGPQPVVLINRYGVADGLSLTVEAAEDTDSDTDR